MGMEILKAVGVGFKFRFKEEGELSRHLSEENAFLRVGRIMKM